MTMLTFALCPLPQAANLTVITAAGDVQEVPLPATFQRLHPLPDAILLSVSDACPQAHRHWRMRWSLLLKRWTWMVSRGNRQEEQTC